MTTKCSISFRCTHAARHTPHTCQKSCREGGAEQDGGRQRRRGGEFVGGEWGSADGMIGGEGDRERVGIFGRRGVEDDDYSGKREKMEGLLE